MPPDNLAQYQQQLKQYEELGDDIDMVSCRRLNWMGERVIPGLTCSVSIKEVAKDIDDKRETWTKVIDYPLPTRWFVKEGFALFAL